MRAWIRAAAIAAMSTFALGANCKNNTVTVPAAGADKPPEIKLTNFVIGGSGTVTPAEVTSSGGPTATATVGPSSKACEIPRLMFIGSAHNPLGGVKDLHVVVTRGPAATVAYDVTVTASAESDGKVPISLPLLGHDTHGGPGSEPLQVSFEGGKRGCPTPETIVVTMTARNFNAQTTTFTETLTAPSLSSDGCICE